MEKLLVRPTLQLNKFLGLIMTIMLLLGACQQSPSSDSKVQFFPVHNSRDNDRFVIDSNHTMSANEITHVTSVLIHYGYPFELRENGQIWMKAEIWNPEEMWNITLKSRDSSWLASKVWKFDD